MTMSMTASVTMHMMMLKRLSSSVQTVSVKSPLRRDLSQATTTSRIPFELLACNLATKTYGGASLPVRRRSLHVRATQVNEPGSIDSPLMQSMQKKIKEQLNADVVIVQDANGDGRHISIDVVSSAFEGKSAVNRQRMVYKAIWEELQTTVHAVDSMTTKTPTELTNN